ncbi:DoxX family membrane protein [Ectobacillus ponti]|uniref:DoxX family membrane protein n=1 Tax=Ectobacillus ponti TaxID=2961894 RepID=A0AA41X2I3_9BACI|nr:DoxX family membrane protein [Ectobacillus ponti]MCP8967716.1 DoxX family membrane protein [Ectobacillus ponti]
MFTEFLIRNGKIKFILFIVRLYVGWVWFSHGFNKIMSKNFDATQFLQHAVAQADAANPTVRSWWAFIVKYAFLPNVEILNYVIPVAELLIGILILAALFTNHAIYFALFLNFVYLLSGSLDVNPQLILWSILLLASKENASRIGLDGMLRRTLKKPAAPVKPPM